MQTHHPVIIVPARLAASRLPNKPLLDISGKPMILRVAEKAKKASIGEVIIACADQEIFDIASTNGFRAVMTDPAIPSGSDRVYSAYKKLSLENEVVINLQGDLPTIDPATISAVYKQLISSGTDIATAVSPVDSNRADGSNSVKAIIAVGDRALYFTRAQAPWGEGPIYHHIGIYAYKRAALEKFMGLAPTPLELREKLEQLRALEHGMSISVCYVSVCPTSVDTASDIEKVRKMWASDEFYEK